MMGHPLLKSLILVMSVLIGVTSGAKAAVNEKLSAEIKPLAKMLVEIVKQEKQTTIAVGDFSGPAQIAASYGSGLRDHLIGELESIQKGIVNPDSVLSVKGDYEYAPRGYKLTDALLAPLAAKGVPENVMAKLKPLCGKVFENRDLIRTELAKTLEETELNRFDLLILKQASENKDLKVIQLKVRLQKNDGEKISEVSQKLSDHGFTIQDSEVVATMMAGTLTLPPFYDREKLNKTIQDNIKKPSFYKNGPRISTSADSKIAIELLATDGQKAPRDFEGWSKVLAREVEDIKGQAYLDIRREEVYAVRIYNDWKYDLAVTMTIDGVDMFTFSKLRKDDGRPKYSHYIIGPGRSLITGWHQTNEEFSSFLVMEYGKGASSRLPNPNPGSVGVITMTFALAWEGETAPEEEKGSRNAGGNETGLGPTLKVDLKEVKRKVGVVREVISVRYTR